MYNKEMTLTWPHLIGLIQADGSFYWTYQNKTTFYPKVFITAGLASYDFFAEVVKPFLERHGLTVNLDPSTKEKAQKFQVDYENQGLDDPRRGRGLNLIVGRIQNCKKLVELIEIHSAPYATLLVGDKLRDFITFKKVLLLNEQAKLAKRGSLNRDNLPKQVIDSSTLKLKVLDLKLKVSLTRGASSASSEAELLKKSGLASDLIVVGAANEEWDEVKRETSTKSDELLKEARTNKHPVLKQFVTGVFDGDGSFQVGTHANIENGSPVPGRTVFELAPMLTLTDKASQESVLFKLMQEFFGSEGKSPTIYKVERDKDADRLYIKGRGVLTQTAIPHFTEYPPILTKNVERFKLFKKTLFVLDQVYKDKSTAVCLITEIYENSYMTSKPRNRDLQEYLTLVDLYFDNKTKE